MTQTAHPTRPLRTIIMAMAVPERVLAQLRAEFPEIRFVVVEEHEDGPVRYASESGDLPASELELVDAIIAWNVPIAMMDAAPHLRWIHSGGAGVSHFDLAAVAARGVTLTNASGVSAPNMAEHVLGMMIALARRFPSLMQSQARRTWRDHDTHAEVFELLDQTLLVVGVGDIGTEVAKRASAFGMNVVGVRRRPIDALPPGFAAIVRQERLHEALSDADQVVLTVPDTPQTRGLFNADAFAAMKRGAMIYNVGRGAVIDTAALIDALRTGQVGGAGLDVTDPEPLPEDSPLWEMDNVFITAHTSGATPRYWERQAALIADNIRRMQRGEAPRNVVDLQAGY